MFERLEAILERYEKINEMMADPAIVTDIKKLTELSKEQRGLEETVNVYTEYKNIASSIEDLKEMDLPGKVYGVCGSGDTFYDVFCKVVDDFAGVFEQTGATKGSDVVKVDLAPEAEDIEHLEKFVAEIVAKQSAL